MRKTFDKEFKMCPISFLLPEEKNSLENYMKEHPKFTFIAKPSRGKGGEGIFLINKFSDLPSSSWGKNEDLLV
jgi:glutathione synthase/RimK-type ligase-like ATP-grasp enzyme